jgi:hypothetical protein
MSVWGEITSNAAHFWDGVNDWGGGVKDAVDEAVDWVTQPRKLLQDSEGNYFGIPGFNTEKIKKSAGDAWTKQQEQGSASPFLNIGSDSFLASSGDYESSIQRIKATDTDPYTAPANSVPYGDVIGATIGEPNAAAISDHLMRAASGDAQNQVITKSVTDEVAPTIILDNIGDGFIKDYETGAVEKVDPDVIPTFVKED